MHLVDDEQACKVGVGAVTCLPRDDVPLFRCGYNDLCLIYFCLRERDVTGEFSNLRWPQSGNAIQGKLCRILPDIWDQEDKIE